MRFKKKLTFRFADYNNNIKVEEQNIHLDTIREKNEKMPTFSNEVYNNLPEFFKQIIKTGGTEEEKDILLLGSIVTISVAFPNVLGRYSNNLVNSNLYLFISASASAGKGILNHCRKIVEPIHLELREIYKDSIQNYEMELKQYNSKKNKDENLEKPKKPARKMLFIPANNSATGFLEILNDSDKSGLIFETEGDTLSKTFNSDYGDFSDGFRKAFHHEPISYYRRTDKEYVEIDRPCLSALLSGTPKQISTLIPDSENGLFSRFIFYNMNMNAEWKNVFESRTDNSLDEYFKELGEDFFKVHQLIKAQPEIIFSLTSKQETEFNQFFKETQKYYLNIQSEEIISFVRRLGLIGYRIMMIFSIIRLKETGEIVEKLTCLDIDFNNTLDIIKVLVKHSNHVFTQLDNTSKKPIRINNKEKFLLELPKKFSRQDYINIAKGLGITEKTAERYIKQFKDNSLINSISHNEYENLSINK